MDGFRITQKAPYDYEVMNNGKLVSIENCYKIEVIFNPDEIPTVVMHYHAPDLSVNAFDGRFILQESELKDD